MSQVQQRRHRGERWSPPPYNGCGVGSEPGDDRYNGRALSENSHANLSPFDDRRAALVGILGVNKVGDTLSSRCHADDNRDTVANPLPETQAGAPFRRRIGVFVRRRSRISLPFVPTVVKCQIHRVTTRPRPAMPARTLSWTVRRRPIRLPASPAFAQRVTVRSGRVGCRNVGRRL